jgi:hypothetical protein
MLEKTWQRVHRIFKCFSKIKITKKMASGELGKVIFKV